MLSYVRIFILLIILLFAGYAYPATSPKFNCAPSSSVMKAALSQGFSFMATAIAHNGAVVQFFINVRTGDFIMIGIDDNDSACALMTGYDWAFAFVRET